jgi:DNA-binding response OmpR family regulator
MLKRRYEVRGRDDLNDIHTFATDDRERAEEVKAIMSQDLEDVELTELGAHPWLPAPHGAERSSASVGLSLKKRPLQVRQFGRIRIDPFENCAAVNSKIVEFSDGELVLLEALAMKQGSYVSKKELLVALYGDPAESRWKVLEVLLSRVKKKLIAALGTGIEPIINSRGRGWSLNLGELEGMQSEGSHSAEEQASADQPRRL